MEMSHSPHIAAAHRTTKSTLKATLLKVYFMCRSVCLHLCLCTTCMADALGGQGKAQDLLELELQMASLHVGTEN